MTCNNYIYKKSMFSFRRILFAGKNYRIIDFKILNTMYIYIPLRLLQVLIKKQY